MSKTITMTQVNETIEAMTHNLKTNLCWTDDMCFTLVADFMETLSREGWKVVEEDAQN